MADPLYWHSTAKYQAILPYTNQLRPSTNLDLSDGSLPFHRWTNGKLCTIGNHWKTIATNGFSDQKPLKNHCYQWFWWIKTIEKPLLAMVFGPKSIGKPLLPMVLETKNHRKTIDINGEQRCMYNKKLCPTNSILFSIWC